MKLRPPSDYLADFRSWATQPDNRIRLGFPGLDAEFRGVAPGELMLLLGRSYVGKSNLLFNLICNRLDTPQIFVSLEMPARQVAARMIAIHYDISHRQLETLVREDDSHIADIFDDAVHAFRNVQIIDTSGVTVDDLDSVAAGVHLVTIDFLERMGGPHGADPLQHVISSARGLKDLAKNRDVAVVALHQVKREGGGWKPLSMLDGRYGGETDSDHVFGVYRPSLDPEMGEQERYVRRAEVVVQILKNRDGLLFPDFTYEMDINTVRLCGASREPLEVLLKGGGGGIATSSVGVEDAPVAHPTEQLPFAAMNELIDKALVTR